VLAFSLVALLLLRHPLLMLSPSAEAVALPAAWGKKAAWAAWAMDVRAPQWLSVWLYAVLMATPAELHNGRAKAAAILSPSCHVNALLCPTLLLATVQLIATPVGATLLAASHLGFPVLAAASLGMLLTFRGLTAIGLGAFGALVLLSMPNASLASAALTATAAAATQMHLVSHLPIGTHIVSAWLSVAYGTAALLAIGLAPLASPFGAVSTAFSSLLSVTGLGQGLWMMAAAASLMFFMGIDMPSRLTRVPWTAYLEARTLITIVAGWPLTTGAEQQSGALILLGILLLIVHLQRLYMQGQEALSHGLHTFSAVEAHGWVYLPLFACDFLRLMIGLLLFRVLVRPLIGLASLILPHPLSYFTPNSIAADYGEGVQMGVAYYVPPRAKPMFPSNRPVPPPQQPQTFVCNIGHMAMAADPRTPHCNDYLRIGLNTIDMTASLKGNEAADAGFCGQYLAEFDDGENVRQLNLTAWASDQAAHAWYVNNPEHRRLVELHRTGGLSTFSSMVARLHAAQGTKIGYHLRCRECHALVQGYPQSRFCEKCGTRCHEMSYF